MKTKLYPYQQKIVDDCKNPANALFMDMGTGKTLTSLALYEKSQCWNLLVVCVKSKVNDWMRDIEYEFNSMHHPIKLTKGSKHSNKTVRDESTPAYTQYVITFESLWRCEELLKVVNDDWFIIIDESHKIKSTNSNVGKYAQKLAQRTTHKVILTGTPQSNGYIDYYNQLYFIDMLKMNLTRFKERYCVYAKVQYGMWNASFTKLIGYKNTDELDSIIHKCVFFERTVAEDLIPSDIIQRVSLGKEYAKLKRDKIIDDLVCDNSSSLFYRLREMCSGVHTKHQYKADWLIDFLEELHDRCVVFYNFNSERDLLKARLVESGFDVYEYNGQKKELQGWLDEENSVILCQYKSASLGINDLVLANNCVFYSLPTSHTDFEQSKKRIDRIGQTRKPLLYYLIAEGSVEEKIYDTLKQRKSFDDKMFERYMEGN